MLVDMHTHSTASDGQHTPSELVGLAKSSGIELIALTDHDTIDGLSEARQAGQVLGVRVLDGIELSAREYHTFHILGYALSPKAPELLALCERLKIKRDERKFRILDFLKSKGVSLSEESVESTSEGGIIGRPHFARAMVEDGYVSSSREAFNNYLDTDEFHEIVEKDKPSAEECISVIKAAGGKACLAHPYQIGLDDERLEEEVRRLLEYGLDAIECWYPRHSVAMTRFYLNLAQRYGLYPTGGSDFHGERVKPGINLTAMDIDVGWLLPALG